MEAGVLAGALLLKKPKHPKQDPRLIPCDMMEANHFKLLCII